MEKRYSIYGEEFHYDLGGVMDALECDGLLAVGSIYYEADCQAIHVTQLINIDTILGAADDTGCAVVGEAWGDQFGWVNAEAKEELEQLILAWAEKYIDVSGYFEIVGDPREMIVTKCDLHGQVKHDN